MKLLIVRCDCCKKQGEGGFIYIQINKRMVSSELEEDEIVGQSDLCEDCYKKLTKGELYNHE